MNIFEKVLNIIFNRPTKFFPYLRQTYLFHQTHLLRKILLNGKSNYLFGNNVRIQGIKCLFADDTAFISIGDHSIVYEHARIEAYGKGIININKNSIIGDARIFSRNKITIGSHFLTSWNVFIQDYDSHPVDSVSRKKQLEDMTINFYPTKGHRPYLPKFEFNFPSEEIVIGDNVWVGSNVTILKGAKIGNNCIIAASAVVLRGEYPNNSILAGNPARVVKTISDV